MTPARKKVPVARKRILLVDDHPITRQGLAAMIGLEPDLHVCGEAPDAVAAIAAVGRLNPDLVVVDLSLPGRNGLEFLKDLGALHPGTAALVLSMHDESLYAERAIRAGARGYLMKSAGGLAVMDAIRTVLSGRIFVSAAVSSRILESIAHPTPAEAPNPSGPDARMRQLSDREFEVFQLIGQGLGTREIAGRLHLGVKTVEAHRAHLKKKLQIRDATALVREAVRWTEAQSGI